MATEVISPERNGVTHAAPEVMPAITQAEPSDNNHSRRRRAPRESSAQLVVSPQKEMEHWRFMPVMTIDQALDRRHVIVEATKQLMVDGVDFGKIPGSEKPSLLQPGADKLCNLFGLVVQYEVTKCIEDWTGDDHGGAPFFFYEIKGRAYRGDFLMGEGIGSCNSWESKYKWRKAERTCPICGKANIRKSRDGGWYCWQRTDGCGTNFAPGDIRIEGQETGRKINSDMADVVNTILKMAQKRSKVSTTINATSASEFFTQDVEDQTGATEDPDPKGFNVDIGSNQYGTREAQQYVAERKVTDLSAQAAARRGNMPSPKPPSPAPKLSSRSGEIEQAFKNLRERIGESRYFEELGMAGVRQNPFELRDLSKIQALYDRLWAVAQVTAERVA
jgi:hypothetical protein